jgi:RNA polymerase sigma factor (sigma-70 family)
LTDLELIQGCLKGNARSQRWLFDKFAGKMMTVCRRYLCDPKEAEDILQESFIKVFRSLGHYRHEGSLEGWIRRIVVHTALRALQKKKIQWINIDQETDTLQSDDIDALTAISAEELLRLIGGLPDGYRIVFNLSVVEGYDHNEIATMMNITPATSRSQLLKARKALQTQIENLKKLPKKYVS